MFLSEYLNNIKVTLKITIKEFGVFTVNLPDLFPTGILETTKSSDNCSVFMDQKHTSVDKPVLHRDWLLFCMDRDMK